MMNTEHTVLQLKHYEALNGRQANTDEPVQLALTLEHNHACVQLQHTQGNITLSLHQVLDLAIFVSHSLEYFREAYHLPAPTENPDIARIGLQGSAATLRACTENENLQQDIAAMSQLIRHDSELLGERMRYLQRLLDDMRY